MTGNQESSPIPRTAVQNRHHAFIRRSATMASMPSMPDSGPAVLAQRLHLCGELCEQPPQLPFDAEPSANYLAAPAVFVGALADRHAEAVPATSACGERMMAVLSTARSLRRLARSPKRVAESRPTLVGQRDPRPRSPFRPAPYCLEGRPCRSGRCPCRKPRCPIPAWRRTNRMSWRFRLTEMKWNIPRHLRRIASRCPG